MKTISSLNQLSAILALAALSLCGFSSAFGNPQEDKGILKVTVHDSSHQNLPIKRIMGGSTAQWILNTSGVRGPLTISATRSKTGARDKKVIALIVNDKAGRRVPIHRVASSLTSQWTMDTTGLTGPVTLSATLSEVN